MAQLAVVEALQVPAELDWMTDLFRLVEPRRVLEIGVYEGGTLKVWIGNAPACAYFVVVDLAHPNETEYASWLRESQSLRVVTGSSQDEQVRDVIRANGPYDWVFIDGDHHLDAVRRDVELALQLVRPGGVLVMHDIANLAHEGPAEVLDDLARSGFRTEQFVAETDLDEAHGVGVVYV